MFSGVCLSVHRGGGPMWPLPMIHWISLYRALPPPSYTGPWPTAWHLVAKTGDLKTCSPEDPLPSGDYYRPQTLKGNVFTPVWFCSQDGVGVGMCVSQHALGGGVSASGTGDARCPQADPPPPKQTPPWADNPLPRDGHWSGRYASYWNAFLLKKHLWSAKADSAHPTEMLSCSYCNKSKCTIKNWLRIHVLCTHGVMAC